MARFLWEPITWKYSWNKSTTVKQVIINTKDSVLVYFIYLTQIYAERNFQIDHSKLKLSRASMYNKQARESEKILQTWWLKLKNEYCASICSRTFCRTIVYKKVQHRYINLHSIEERSIIIIINLIMRVTTDHIVSRDQNKRHLCRS